MGKSKGSQRTKGNVRPSSSGRTAELMGSDARIGFIGFESMKMGHVAQETDSDIDGMFSMVMKKMLKKDTTTRLKALQEFKDLINQKDKNTVISILPFWPRLYNKLALDFDRRVRETVQEAHGNLGEKVKRDMAPYLKNIMGVWLLSQSDTYMPAASVARTMFTSIFPKEKQAEALMFCKTEILSFFKENLFQQTLQTLSEPNVEAEDIENKYILIVSGSLHGIRQFLSTISADEKKIILEDIKSIITENKFWKFSKHESTQVRVAWYNLISILCQDLSDVFPDFEHKLGCSVLGCLAENDPAVASAIWEAALHYIVAFKNCWDIINIYKIVLPQLWILLKEGGRGNAFVLYPCLLPLLSKLPENLTQEKPQFFKDFFGHMSKSLFLPNVTKSQMECNAIISAYMECLQYVCVQLSPNIKDKSLISWLLCEELVSLVAQSFSEAGSHIVVSNFYSALGKLIQTLENYATREKSSFNEQYIIKESLAMFWEKITDICLNFLYGNIPNCSDVKYLAHFIRSMYDPNSCIQRKKCKVKFSDEGKVDPHAKLIVHTDLNNTVSPSSIHRMNIYNCVIRICRAVCHLLRQDLSLNCLQIFREIIRSFPKRELFQDVLKEYEIVNCKLHLAPSIFFEHAMLTWISNAKDYITVDYITDIVFVICQCIEEKHLLEFLDQCFKVENMQFISVMLSKSINRTDSHVYKEWLQRSSASNVVVVLLRYAIQSLPDSDTTFSIAGCFICLQNIISGVTVSEKCIEEILITICDALQNVLDRKENCIAPNTLVSISYLLVKIYTKYGNAWILSVSGRIVKLAFHLSLSQMILSKDEHAKEDLYKAFSEIWLLPFKNPMHLYSNSELKGFVPKATCILHNLILQNTLVSPQVLETTLRFLISLQKSGFDDDCSKSHMECDTSSVCLSETINSILPCDDEWFERSSNLFLHTLPAFLEKKLFYPLPVEQTILQPALVITSHMVLALNVSDIILQYIEKSKHKQTEKIIVELIMKQLPHLLWSFAYCDSHGYLKNEDSEECICARKLQKSCFRLLAYLPKHSAYTVLEILYRRSIQDGFLWFLPLKCCIEILKTLFIHDTMEFLDRQELYNQDTSDYITQQTLIHYASIETKASILKTAIRSLMQRGNVTDAQYFGLLANVCCCLQDENIFDNLELKRYLESFLREILSDKNELLQKNEFLFSMMVVVIINQMIKHAVTSMERHWSYLHTFLMKGLLYCEKMGDQLCLRSSELIFAYRMYSTLYTVLSILCNDNNDHHMPVTQKERNDFLSGISKNVLCIFIQAANVCKSFKTLPRVVESFLSAQPQCIEFLSSEQVLDSLLQSVDKFGGSNYDSDADMVHATLKNMLQYLICDIRPLQLGIHMFIMKVMPLLPALQRGDESKTEGKSNKLTPFINIIQQTSQVLDNMLCEIRIGDSCIIVPNTDSYFYAMAYLLIWLEFFEYLSTCTIQEFTVYTTHLENENFLSSLLKMLFRLMPENPATCYKSEDDRSLKAHDVIRTAFTETPMLSPSDPACAEDIQLLACHTYYSALKQVPVIARMWWNNLDKKSSEVVNKYTSKYISGIFCSKEIQAVQESGIESHNLTIKVRPGTREVIATYVIDSKQMELSIQLPPNYPLGVVIVSDAGSNITKSRWKQRIMQLTAFLAYQNDSVLNGLLLWKRNLDKKFEGEEECMICFSILDDKKEEVPERSCQTCKKKFHNSCMYTWFVTSNNATCPLCRSFF